MTIAGVLWPTKDEYDIAIARWTETMWDADLRSGMLDYDNLGIRRYGGANLYVSIYKIGHWMVRCFCSKPSMQAPIDIRERYRAIDRFCRTQADRVSALIPVTYLEQGITVGTRVLPIVKMPFLVGCPSLGEFLLDAYEDRATMQRLCEAWLRMVRELEAAPMAHGDLDLTNVLVEQRGPNLTLRLIDYDNTWIPELAGRSQTEYGHTNFQHPSFLPPRQRPYNAEMDRFSALVIYISLKTLVAYPKLYDEWGADESDRLLLSETDYQHAGLLGSRMQQLRKLSTPDVYPYLDELNASLRAGRMPRSLTDIDSLTPFVPQSSSQATQFQKALGPQGPAISIWKDAVYNPGTLAPPSLPPVQSIQPLYGSQGANIASTPPWQRRGSYQKEQKAPRGKRRALILVIICVLLLILLTASTLLVIMLTTNHHIGNITPPIGALLRNPAYPIFGTEGGAYVATYI